MRKIIIGAVIALASVLVYRSCMEDRREQAILQESSMLIQQEIRNVSKLIVTEGHFSEVYNYKDSREFFGPLVTANKKALVVVNAEVQVAYDLSKIEYELDGPNKTLRIVQIPEPEIKMSPKFEYYDVRADYFNPFSAQDYNAIDRTVRASLMKKVEASSLSSNANNRLLSELSKILVVTNSMGWTLEYGGNRIDDPKKLWPLGDAVLDQP